MQGAREHSAAMHFLCSISFVHARYFGFHWINQTGNPARHKVVEFLEKLFHLIIILA